MVIERLIDRLLSMQNGDGGWAYTSGKSWTEPTAFAILALLSARSSSDQVQRASLWLKRTQLADGGWPPTADVAQSGAYTSGEIVASYPETTGLSLLALKALSKNTLRASLDRAQSFSHNPDSLEGWAWLHMALVAHGLEPPPLNKIELQPRTSRDLALCLLALTAGDNDNRLTRGMYA